MKVVSTDHKQANNLTSLIICFLKQRIFFLFVFFCLSKDQYNFLICFYLNVFFYFMNPRHPLYILVPGEQLFLFNFWLCNGYIYLYKKRIPLILKWALASFNRRPPINTTPWTDPCGVPYRISEFLFFAAYWKENFLMILRDLYSKPWATSLSSKRSCKM